MVRFEASRAQDAAAVAASAMGGLLSDHGRVGSTAVGRMVLQPSICSRMQLAKRPCAGPGCGELVDSGCCPAHSSQASARQHDRARRDDPQRMRTNSTRWLKLRAIVLRRDPVCRICGQEASTDADHIIPIRAGGAKWLPENLQGLCHACHTKKTRREGHR
jgi:5-methylcytosine-specific restriction enzyme A